MISMITNGRIKIYDGMNGEAIYNLGNYGLGWLTARISEREQIIIESLSNSGNVTQIDSGFNWEHSVREDL